MYNEYHGYETVEPSQIEKLLGPLAGVTIVLVVLLILIGLAIAIITLVAQCKVYTKAGEKWWKGIIPLYSTWVLTKITGLAWWWFLIYAGLTAAVANFDGANSVLSIGLLLTSFNIHYNLSKKFGKTNGFAVLITLLPFIGYPLLAFGNAKYEKNAKVDKNGIFEV